MARLLLIDGYDESRDTSAKELRAAGYEVIAVTEEAEALAAVGALDAEALDFVVLDLPIAEAEEAAAAVRMVSTGRNAIVVAVVDPTDSRRMRDEAHAKGIDYFFLRPCAPAEIVKQLRRIRRS
jgi:DNA-binding response OmpR family regulator